MIKPPSLYRQVRISKPSPTGTGTLSRVIWGPDKAAHVGRVVKVEEDDGIWSEGWTVDEVYGLPLPEKLVVHRSHDYKRQRKASDI